MYNPIWSEEKNKNIFDKCNNPNYNGHDYELEVTVRMFINIETRYVIDTKYLSDLINKNVLEKFEPVFKYIKKRIPDFKDVVTPEIGEHKFARGRYLNAIKSSFY